MYRIIVTFFLILSAKLRAVFSDGAGSYLAEWKVVGNLATRTLLTADDKIVTAFFEKPAPIKQQKNRLE